MSETEHNASEEAQFADELSDKDKLQMLQEAILSCEQNMITLQEQRDTYLEQLKRSQADFENYKKRVRRDIENEGRRVARNFLEQLVPILDNLDYALAAIDENSDIYKPICMIKEGFERVLKENGVTKIEPQEGEVFNPEIHQAISVIPADVSQQQIGHIARIGYMVGDQVFRPSDVVVQKPK